MRFLLAGAILLLALLEFPAARANGPRFYVDDPLWTLHDTQDASGVAFYEFDADYDAIENMFAHPGEPEDRVARDINTIGEVPDSSWFTNRVGHLPLTPDDVARGPDRTSGPAPGAWTIISAKTTGIMPGFVVRDTAGVVWFVKFDPVGYRGMASGAEVITTKLLWALGYHVPENHVALVAPGDFRIDPTATIRMPNGRRAMRATDVPPVLRRAARDADGRYRVLASRQIDGKPAGPFRFYGVRPDDPNDYVPHEHRRELRGFGTFAAWLNHVDSKSINTLDALVVQDGRTLVRHYLLDFGSTLGSAGVGPREPFEGAEYLYDGRDALASAFSFGFRVKPWRTVPEFRSPAAGALPMAADWDPEHWRPRYANPAFVRARWTDKFWAARKLQALTPDLIEAAVAKAGYGDPATDAAVLRFLLARRTAILARYLTAGNPVVQPSLDRKGTLTFTNAAVDADVAPAPGGYRTVWSVFDNETGLTEPLGECVSRSTFVTAPWPLRGEFVRVEISATSTRFTAWTIPIEAYFRNEGLHWRLVGLEREPTRLGAAVPQWTSSAPPTTAPDASDTGEQTTPGSR